MAYGLLIVKGARAKIRYCTTTNSGIWQQPEEKSMVGVKGTLHFGVTQ